MRRLVMVGAAGTMLLLAGCSSTASESTSAASATPGGATDRTAYVQCLSEHGVTLPSGSGNGGGPGGFGGMGNGTAPSGVPTDRPTDFPSGVPSGFPSGGPPAGGGSGNGAGMGVPEGVDEDTWTAAREACASLAPTGRPGGMGGQNGGSGSTATASSSPYTVFWQCMSDHKVTAPASGLPKDLDESDATVKAAREVCDALLPSGS